MTVSALLRLPLSTSRMEIFCGKFPGNFCPLLAIQVLPWLQAAFEFGLPVRGWV